MVERPCHEIVAELEGGAAALFRQSLGEAEADLDRLQLKVGPEKWPVLLAKTVEVQFGPLRRHGDVTLFAFSWQATGSGSLFPGSRCRPRTEPGGRDQDRADPDGPLPAARRARPACGRIVAAQVGRCHRAGFPFQPGRQVGLGRLRGRPRRPLTEPPRWPPGPMSGPPRPVVTPCLTTRAGGTLSPRHPVTPSRLASNSTPLKLAASSDGQKDAGAVGRYSASKIALLPTKSPRSTQVPYWLHCSVITASAKGYMALEKLVLPTSSGSFRNQAIPSEWM